MTQRRGSSCNAVALLRLPRARSALAHMAHACRDVWAPHAPFGKNLIRCTAGVAVQFAQHKQDGDKDEGHDRGKDGAQQVDDHLKNKVNISEVMHVMLPSTKYQLQVKSGMIRVAAD